MRKQKARRQSAAILTRAEELLRSRAAPRRRRPRSRDGRSIVALISRPDPKRADVEVNANPTSCRATGRHRVPRKLAQRSPREQRRRDRLSAGSDAAPRVRVGRRSCRRSASTCRFALRAVTTRPVRSYLQAAAARRHARRRHDQAQGTRVHIAARPRRERATRLRVRSEVPPISSKRSARSSLPASSGSA